MENPFLAPVLWYFAYGSNMSTAKFTGGRGIHPLATARVQVPGWTLAFNIPGIPYSEPSFTSIIPRVKELVADYPLNGSRGKRRSTPNVLGVAYLITQEQYIHMLASEGGGIMYTDIELDAVPLTAKDREATGPMLKVRTLVVVPMMERVPWPLPSERYMQIITSGSRENQMPDSYQGYLESREVYPPPSSKRGKLGASIFLSIWGPIMGLMEKITNATMSSDGRSPSWVIWLVRSVVLMVWWTHDTFFAPVFGRGDGLGKDMMIGAPPLQRRLDLEGQPLFYIGEKGLCKL
ncbi:hypothetical protein OCU04_000187 [Sclerotinia nivalis]|uniref:gamma-glutamylcyclotransferase n=1 Tax=Sclerotinia nivalis TaxID=352851 RepID=A0A9X0DNH2_9HELO|nr:hypothetical protein OCU04_000187 [Sclerotinia nivalis]